MSGFHVVRKNEWGSLSLIEKKEEQRMSKTVKLLFSFILVFSMFVVPAGATYAEQKDDLTGHSLESEMRRAIELGVLSGYGKGRYGPNDKVTRAQFATFVARALKLPSGKSSFSDVPEGYLLADGIGRAASAGIVGGYPGGVFRPEEYISREQMAVMIDRALAYKKVNRTKIALTFTDTAQIHPTFRDAVAHNAYFGIIRGMPAGKAYRFGPKDDATRAHGAAFIVRMLDVINSGKGTTEFYHVGSIAGSEVALDGQPYLSFADAEKANAELIFKGEKLLKMKSGTAAASPKVDAITRIFADDRKTQRTYVAPGTELQYVSSDEAWVRVRYADSEGLVKQQDVTLIPTALQKGKSYYIRKNGVVQHQLFNPITNTSAVYFYGDAPSFMQENVQYFSLNGRDFYNGSNQKVGTAYQYFNHLPLRTKTNYTAEDLNRYIKSVTATINGKVVAQESPLRNLGEAFKRAEAEYGINALYLFAKAIHESSYGLSEIAQQKKNLFGYKAYDRDPLGSADSYSSFESSIMAVAAEMNEHYLTPEGVNYRGAVLGNKSYGMNVNYASDPFWGQKIAGHMYRADSYLGKKDFGYYTLARTTEALNVRPEPNTNKASQYRYPGANYYVALLEESKQADGTWYKIYSDSKNHEFGYVHGNYVERLPLLTR